MDSLYHHNGIIDHNGNRKHESRQGNEVDGEPYEVHHKESTNQSHRDGNSRDNCRTYILQEHVYHEEHKDECLYKCVYHSVDGGKQEIVVVHRHHDVAAVGQIVFDFVYQCQAVFDNLGSI